MDDITLLPCPFCGGPATFEECPQASSAKANSCTWSVGCANEEIDCIGYQMLASFDRKGEAAEAWNKRTPTPTVETVSGEMERLREHINQLQAKLHCMCGSEIDHSPWEGHSPVSMFDYAVDQEVERRLSAARTSSAPAGAGWQTIDAAAHEAASEDGDPIIIGWYSLDGAWQWVPANWTGEEWDAGDWEIDHCAPTHWLQPRNLPLPAPPAPIADEGTKP